MTLRSPRALRAVLAFSVLVPLLAQTHAWPPEASRYRIHMIGQAHIDPVWLWPWPEGLAVVLTTFRSALDRMKEDPEFVFTASSAQFYQWVADSDPQMLAEIRRRVADGRWDVVGGWWVEPDVNMPSGEALVRQGLYGQLTLRRLLGRGATVAYNPDSFGHPGTLPQILKLQEMSDYVFMRPKPNEKALPSRLFWWEAPDGTRVLAYRIPMEYNDEGDVRGRILDMIHEPQPARDVMAFYGVGDHGGGATKQNLRSIEQIRGEAGAPKLIYGGPDEYFAEVRKSDTSSLPVVKDDLQHHSVGCYTAESEMKKSNRAAELALLDAEKLSAVGAAAWGAAYPKAEFTRAWEKVLFLQFHDSLAGTALPEHYATTAREGYGYAMSVAHNALYEAAQRVAWQIPTTDPDSQYLVAFNLQAWPVTAWLEYDLEWNTSNPAIVEDENGRQLAHQWIPATSEVQERKRLVVEAPLPAFGYRQLRIRRGQPETAASRLSVDQHGMANEHLRVTVGADGTIGIYDNDAQRRVFQGSGARALVMDDPSDTWSHDVRAYDRQIGVFGNASVRVVERGPLRGRVQVKTTYGASALTVDWLLYAGSRTLEARVTLDWREHRKMLKFSFPVAVAAPVATYEVPYGSIARPANGDESPGQRWIDVSAGDGGYGLSAINDAKYGYSVGGSDMRISLVRGAPYAHHQPAVLDPNREHIWQDQGVQTFRILLVPHKGTWKDANIPRAAEEFTAAAPIVWQGIHAGSSPPADSFLSVDARDIVITAIKQAEDGDGLVMRGFETTGRPASASIDLRFLHKKWTGAFRPYEIKTLRVNAATGEVRQVNALEEVR